MADHWKGCSLAVGSWQGFWESRELKAEIKKQWRIVISVLCVISYALCILLWG